jgi:hypothetical protein
MSTSIHIGKKRVQTVSASDGSTIPPGAVSAVCNFPTFLAVEVDPLTNAVTLTGLNSAPSGTTVSVAYSAPGYQPISQSIVVAPLPALIVTDGPEQ